MSTGSQLPNLDKILRDDEESFFVSSGGSNLAAIFGVQSKAQDVQTHTKHQTNKKPPPAKQQSVPTSKTEVIIAKAVHAFKLQNGSYVSVGTLGMALVVTIPAKTYQIILYRKKQEYLSVVTVTHDFVYTVQANNYSSYYDNNKDNWSILFETNDICTEFAREVGLARYFSREGRIENIVFQDLTPITKEDIQAKEGDNITVKYFNITEIVQPFKNNSIVPQSMTVQISTDDNWERILLGATKGLKRTLFLPPSKQISLGPGFPKEKDVMLEIEITDLQTPEENPQTLKSTASGKASIISRMAKMGQSILPKLPSSTTTDSEDTEDDVSHKSPLHKKTDALGVALQKKNSQETTEELPKNVHKLMKSRTDVLPSDTSFPKPLVSASAFAPQWSPSQIQPNYVTMEGQVYSFQPQAITSTVPAIMDPNVNMLLSETRMQNAELRMGMSKIADNVQKLLDKFHVLELQNAATPTSDRAMDTTLKMLLAMNASQAAAKEIEVQKSTDSTNNPASDHFLKIKEMENEISTLQGELKDMKETFASNKQLIQELQAERESLLNANAESCREIQELQSSLTDANSALQKANEDLDKATKSCEEFRKMNAEKEERISMLLVECNNEKAARNSEDRDKDSKNKEIKQIMNRTYHTLLEKFVEESYSTDYIKSTVASTIKNITLQVLHGEQEKNEEELESSSMEDGSTISSKEPSTSSALNNIPAETSKHTGISRSFNIVPAVQDEPPPIPPMDPQVENDWLHL